MWNILESRDVQRTLPKLPLNLRERYEAWKLVVRIQGPQGLRTIKGFHDESLKGPWHGHRSSRLNLQYRIIYRVENHEVTVHVERVTPHDDRR
jgi:addiction module RelE/StbE family toxin